MHILEYICMCVIPTYELCLVCFSQTENLSQQILQILWLGLQLGETTHNHADCDYD